MSLALSLKLAGLIFFGLAAAHFSFPKRFGWREELSRLSLLNRQIFWVHCAFIVLVLCLFGALCLFFTEELLAKTALGRLVAAGLLIFSAVRLYVQLAVYDPKLWKGDRFNTRVHVLFIGLWVYFVAVFGGAFWHQW